MVLLLWPSLFPQTFIQLHTVDFVALNTVYRLIVFIASINRKAHVFVISNVSMFHIPCYSRRHCPHRSLARSLEFASLIHQHQTISYTPRATADILTPPQTQRTCMHHICLADQSFVFFIIIGINDSL